MKRLEQLLQLQDALSSSYRLHYAALGRAISNKETVKEFEAVTRLKKIILHVKHHMIKHYTRGKR